MCLCFSWGQKGETCGLILCFVLGKIDEMMYVYALFLKEKN